MRVAGAGINLDSCSSVLRFVSRGGPISVEVSSCLGGGGDYTLTLQVISAGPSNCGVPLECGLTPLGVGLSTLGEVDSYAFDAAAGERVEIAIFDEQGKPEAYQLRLFDRDGEPVIDRTCADSTSMSVPSTGTYTALVSSCAGLRTSPYRIGRRGARCPEGPVVTYFAFVPRTSLIDIPSQFDELGRPIYERARGIIVVEAGLGDSLAPVGGSTFEIGDLPDLQLMTNRRLGDGNPDVCDLDTNPPGGVPESSPFVFGADMDSVARINDFGCRFDDGLGNPLGRRSPLEACTLHPNGQFDFVAEDTAIQFCAVLSTAEAFPEGDTVLKVRVRDRDRILGAERQLIVRVPTGGPATVTPTPTPTPTSTPTQTAQATPEPGPCIGDCDEDGRVTISELTRAVRIALELDPVAVCRRADANGDGVISISELTTAVRYALNGCPPAP
jgi:hypothetical protein